MGNDKERGRSLSTGCWVGIGLLCVCLAVFSFLAYRIFRAYQTMALARPILKAMDKGGTKATYSPLPMITHYGEEMKKIVFPKGYPRLEDRAFHEAVLPFKEKAFALARQVVGPGFSRDWREGVAHLGDPQPRWTQFDKVGNTVNYRDCRNFALSLNHLGRFLMLESRPREALRLHLASFSLPRQMFSLQKQSLGLTLMDAMIALAILGEGARGLLDLGTHTSWQQDLFLPAFRERCEGIHDRLPFVAEAMKLERGVVASFFHELNEKASQRAGHPVIIRDTNDVQGRANYYHPPLDVFKQPYCLVEEKLKLYERRSSESASLASGDYVKAAFYPMSLIERYMQSISVPNVRKARLRECHRTALLRGCYLAYAIAGHYAKHGAYPGSLDGLGPKVKASMRLDPFTGEAFRYRAKGKTFRLWSAGLAGKAAMDEPREKSIIIVPWKRKTK